MFCKLSIAFYFERKNNKLHLREREREKKKFNNRASIKQAQSWSKSGDRS